MIALFSVLAGMLLALLVAATVLLIAIYRFAKNYDVNILTDEWYPVRVKKFPFTVDGSARSIR